MQLLISATVLEISAKELLIGQAAKNCRHPAIADIFKCGLCTSLKIGLPSIYFKYLQLL